MAQKMNANWDRFLDLRVDCRYASTKITSGN
jgi:hypothetical protein